ncbi:MAG: hypothetical protein H8E61_03425, partial [Bacteroidetes bacterium]|nr:hypothetical protein [Bacteroidota bacterium]
MMKFERSIREERIVQVKVVDETKPLFNMVSEEELLQIVGNINYSFKTHGDYFSALTPV